MLNLNSKGTHVTIFSGLCTIWNSASIKQKSLFYIVLLVVVGSGAYSNSLTVPFILDDHYSIDFIGKKTLLEHLLHGGSRRVADMTFAMNHHIHGLQVAGYHIINLAIHLIASIAVYFIMSAALSALRVSYVTKDCAAQETSLIEQYIPIATSLLFVCHPVQTQAVTYIIQRYTSLATLFYLLSVLSFIQARLSLERSGVSSGFRFLAGGTVAAGFLAIGCKQIAATLPLMLLLLECFLFRCRLVNRRFFIACGSVVFVVMTIVLVKWYSGSLNDLLIDLNHATVEDGFTTRWTYFLTQTRVVTIYLGLLLLPIGQSITHDSPVYTSLFIAPVIASLAVHMLLITTAIITFRISGQNLQNNVWLRGALQRLTSMGIFWFYIAMAVESSFIPIKDIIFEHRMYLPSVGFFITIVSLCALFFQGRQAAMKEAVALLIVTCTLCTGLTIARNRIWNNPLLLWQEAVNQAPNKALAVANLAGAYMVYNMPERALPFIIRALELNPNISHMTKISLGVALKELHLFESRYITTGEEYILPGGAMESGLLDYKNMSRWDSVICNNMGLAYEYLQEPVKALHAYKSAVALYPEYVEAWYNLSLLATRLGDGRLAEESIKNLNLLKIRK